MSDKDKFTDVECEVLHNFLLSYFDDIEHFNYPPDMISARMNRNGEAKGIYKDRIKYETWLIKILAEFMEKNNFQYTYISGPIYIAVRVAKHIFI